MFHGSSEGLQSLVTIKGRGIVESYKFALILAKPLLQIPTIPMRLQLKRRFQEWYMAPSHLFLFLASSYSRTL